MSNTIPIYVHVDLLYSDFLLQRILVKRSLTGPETLISLANQMLKAILVEIAITQRCGQPFGELGWTVDAPFFY